MGISLVDSVCDATGLPKKLIQTELIRLLKEEGVEPENATMDDLRNVIILYLQDVLLSNKQIFE